jgi:hypothetical protein
MAACRTDVGARPVIPQERDLYIPYMRLLLAENQHMVQAFAP